MTSSLQIVTYELFTLEHSGWVLHSRYPSSDRQEAISEAKGIELNLERATKLVREVYHPDRNTYDEAVVRISPNLVEFKKKLRQQKRAMASAGSGAAHDPFAQYAPGAEFDDKPMKPRQVITGVTMMTFSALAIAIGVTAIASLLLKTHVLAQYVSERAAPQVLFGTFLVVFLLAALPLISRYIPHFGSSPNVLPDDFSVEMPKEEKKSPEMHDRPEDESVEKVDGPPALFKDDPGLIDTPPEPEGIPEVILEPEPEPKPKAKKKKKAEPKPEPKPEPEITIEITDDVDEDEDASPVPDKQRMLMMRFLTGTITILKDVCPQLDTYNKFGLNLIMAGACASLGQRAKLSEDQIQALTQESITMLGSKASLAADFCRKLSTYVDGDPRYAEMYQHGHNALEAYADQTGAPFDDIGAAMRSWNKPTGRVTGAKIVTIMFTDIVSSTLITYKRGDHKAQAYIRRHNRIVRQALAQFSGDEIKHTGDGIMACFTAPSDAILAAVAIQKAIHDHNHQHPDEAFELRIGMNTGEPIREDNDLFGSSVQLAARTCGAAGAGHIYISNVVRELVASNNYPMLQLPPRTLKGVKEAQTFYDLQWTEFPDPPQMSVPDEDETTEEDNATPPEDSQNPLHAGGVEDETPIAAPTANLTPDQVLNAAQQEAVDDDAKTQEASTIIKR